MAHLRFPEPPLADEVVRLRPWQLDDIPDRILSVFGHSSVQRFSWPETRNYTEADARRFFFEQEQARIEGTALSFAFVEPGDLTAVLGGGSLYGIDHVQARAAVGYWLAPTARGRGVATRATRLLARWAFAGLGVARLELTCAPDNERSQRVAERCGFVREGVLRSHMTFKGSRRDSVMFSLLPDELR